jgi:hypothetical protein
MELIADINQEHGISLGERLALRQIARFHTEGQIYRGPRCLPEVPAVPVESKYGPRGATFQQGDTELATPAPDVEDGAKRLARRERRQHSVQRVKSQFSADVPISKTPAGAIALSCPLQRGEGVRSTQVIAPYSAAACNRATDALLGLNQPSRCAKDKQ